MDHQEIFEKTREAARKMSMVSAEKINKVLLDLANHLIEQTAFLLSENEKDLARMSKDDPRYDRLKLTTERIASISKDTINVAGLPSPIGTVLSAKTLKNNLRISKVSVPIGVIGIIYEARPNVTCDAFVLCF